jgi:xanthine dehydrogenase accessory factor
MVVYADGRSAGTIGGGKFEALVIEEAAKRLAEKTPFLKRYPLRENEAESFGAICGGEVTVLIEPQIINEAIVLVGGGHCSQAIARLAFETGLHVTILEDRPELLVDFTHVHQTIATTPPASFIAERTWQPDEALVIVSRNYLIDQEALGAALGQPGISYIGMIGSRRKVLRVFDELENRGLAPRKASHLYAPIGLDIGADSPAEIAISVLAEVLRVLRKKSGTPLRMV